MRKFKVLKCKQTRLVYDIKKKRNSDGNLVSYKEYRVEEAGENGWWPGAYGHEKIKEGDIIELEGYRADKAAANPAFEEIFPAKEAAKEQVDSPEEQVVKPAKKAAKKKVGRPKKKVA